MSFQCQLDPSPPPIEQSNHALIPVRQILHEFTVPKNTDPNVNFNLKHEHNAIDSDINHQTETETLIPDLKPILWCISSRYEFIYDKCRFRCGYPNCAPKTFRDFEDLECHLNDRHDNEMAHFRCPHCHEVIETTNNRRFAILHHFRWHGRFLAECIICEKQCAGNYQMLKHIITNHPDDCIRYRSRYIDNNFTQKQECTIWLECKVCGVRVESTTKAKQHLMQEHKSHNMDFITIKMVKQTKAGITSCYTSEERRAYSCERSMVCNICDLPIKLKSNLNVHFNRDHPMQEIALRATSIHINQCHPNGPENSYLDFSDNLAFYCVHCNNNTSNHQVYNTVKDVHTHWKQLHSTGIECKPFAFHFIEFVQCLHCNFIGSLATVRQHSKNMHPNASFAISHLHDTNACPLYPNIGDDFQQHIEIDHGAINRTCFSDDIYKRLRTYGESI